MVDRWLDGWLALLSTAFANKFLKGVNFYPGMAAFQQRGATTEKSSNLQIAVQTITVQVSNRKG